MSLAERLVGPETHDGQTEGVHGKLIVLHVLAEDIGDAGCPSPPLEFGMVRRIAVRLPYVDVQIKNVILDDLRQSPYSARESSSKNLTALN